MTSVHIRPNLPYAEYLAITMWLAWFDVDYVLDTSKMNIDFKCGEDATAFKLRFGL